MANQHENTETPVKKAGPSMSIPKIIKWILGVAACAVLIAAGFKVQKWLDESKILRQVIERLSAETRVAEILVTKSEYDEQTKKIKTTIKFLEYGTAHEPLQPKYFTFSGNVIQFQSLVIRFEDRLVKAGDKLKGKSAFLFMKAFVLDGKNTQEFIITEAETIPSGYKIKDSTSEFEAELWKVFWNYALDPAARQRAGVKNAQIEAPGTMFLPGTIYTVYIEHDGGMKIDSRPVPAILKGEVVS